MHRTLRSTFRRSKKRADTGDRGVSGEADPRDHQRRREWHEAHQRELLAQYPTARGRDGFQATRVVVTDIVDVLADGIEIEGSAEVAINHR